MINKFKDELKLLTLRAIKYHDLEIDAIHLICS